MKTDKPSLKAEHQPGTARETGSHSRRSFFDRLGMGALLAAIGGQAAMMLRALMPNVLYEPPRKFKIGPPNQFPQGVTFLENERLYIFRTQRTFYAISAICTHLGCTVKMLQLPKPQTVQIRGKIEQEQQEFRCPCHGSRYYGDGTNYAGPAPAPLPRYRLEVAPDDGQLIVNLTEPVGRDFRLTV